MKTVKNKQIQDVKKIQKSLKNRRIFGIIKWLKSPIFAIEKEAVA